MPRFNFATKQPMRSILTKSAPAKAAAFLPAEDALCVHEAYKNGTIDLHTKLYLFDWSKGKQKSRDKLASSMAKLRQLGFTQMEPFAEDALFLLPILIGAQNFNPDFVFLDLCGEYSEQVKRTIDFLVPYCPVSVVVRSWSKTSKNIEFTESTAHQQGLAAAILGNERKRQQLGFEPVEVPPASYAQSINIVASMMSGIRKRTVKFADHYQGIKHKMLGVQIA